MMSAANLPTTSEATTRFAENTGLSRESGARSHASSGSLSISGHHAPVINVDGDLVSVHTSVRLCPGRRVSVRVGSRSVAASVVSSRIEMLRADRLTYTVQLAFAVPAADLLCSVSTN